MPRRVFTYEMKRCLGLPLESLKNSWKPPRRDADQMDREGRWCEARGLRVDEARWLAAFSREQCKFMCVLGSFDLSAGKMRCRRKKVNAQITADGQMEERKGENA